MLISRNLLSILAGCLLAVLAPAAASAQTPTNDRPSPVAYASVSELNNILAQVRDVAQSIDGDLAKTRIDRWKADAATKRDAQANVESIRRNVKSALPDERIADCPACARRTHAESRRQQRERTDAAAQPDQDFASGNSAGTSEEGRRRRHRAAEKTGKEKVREAEAGSAASTRSCQSAERAADEIALGT